MRVIYQHTFWNGGLADVGSSFFSSVKPAAQAGKQQLRIVPLHCSATQELETTPSRANWAGYGARQLSHLIEKNKGLARDVASLSEALTEITKAVSEVARTNHSLYSDMMLIAAVIKDLSPAPRSYDSDNPFSPFPKDDDDGYLN